jgi:hypothetical protein
MSQFGTRQAGALSSVGSTLIFNVDREDAGHLKKDLLGRVDERDLITLEVGQVIARVTTKRRTEIVRIRVMPPLAVPDQNCREAIIAHSKQRYYKPVDEVRRIVDQRSREWDDAPEVGNEPAKPEQRVDFDEF